MNIVYDEVINALTDDKKFLDKLEAMDHPSMQVSISFAVTYGSDGLGLNVFARSQGKYSVLTTMIDNCPVLYKKAASCESERFFFNSRLILDAIRQANQIRKL